MTQFQDEHAQLRKQIALLKAQNNQLHHELAVIRRSLIYRVIARPIWSVRHKLFPENSKRYRTYRQFRQRLRHWFGLASSAATADPVKATAGDRSLNAGNVFSLVAPEQSTGVLNVPHWEKPDFVAPTPQSIVICTIISKNYIAYARTLMESIQQYHPDVHLVVLLVDTIDGYYEPEAECFETVLASDLNIPHWQHFAMKYTILELNTAVKPYLLEVLFDRYQAQKVIYFDPDILVYRRLDDLLAYLDGHDLVLTPHITAPIDDGYRPSEQEIMQAGIYNLGFVAFSRQGKWRELLHWWQDKLYHYCLVDIENHQFVDQRWMDFAPALSASPLILHHAGYNVAYWNLKNRTLTTDSDGYLVNGQPLVFFHFSGFDLKQPEAVSKHQNRFVLTSLNPATQTCFMDYAQRLAHHGYEETRVWPYAYAYFDDGTPISDIARVMLRENDLIGERWSRPYNTQDNDSFFIWLTQPDNRLPVRHLSRYALKVYTLRPDLQARFPDILGEDELKFANWFINSKDDPVMFHPGYVDPIKDALKDNYFPRQVTAAVDATADGVNLIGYAYSETGIGQLLRGMLSALAERQFPLAVQPLTRDDAARKRDFTVASYPQGMPHPVNVFVVNADMTFQARDTLPHSIPDDRYNIGVWAWELADFPTEWLPCFDVYNEIWAISQFNQETFAAHTTKPVKTIPLPVSLRVDPMITRSSLGLPEDAFIVYFAFDALSVFERKNPLAVVRAFERAFVEAERRTDVRLVIKSNNLARFPTQKRQLQRAVQRVNGILLDGYRSVTEVHALYALCDVYISLHRSEGFGFTMAEAMAAGKPVIGTGYSGNLDFMTADNSYLVPYELVELERDYLNYKAGSVWASPDIEAAAGMLRQIYMNPVEAAMKGQRAAQYMQQNHNQQVVGNALSQRLQTIMRNRAPSL